MEVSDGRWVMVSSPWDGWEVGFLAAGGCAFGMFEAFP